MPLMLALDTSSQACSIALWDNALIVEEFQVAARQQSQVVMPLLDQVLAQASVSRDDIDVIAVTQGPGSFMGVRLGISIAQGLAYALNLPVVAVSSLQVLAQVGFKALSIKHLLAGWDARMEAMYWGEYAVAADGIALPLREDQLSSPEAVVIDSDGASVACVGNAWSVYAERLALKSNDVIVDAGLYPRASALAEVASYLYQQGRMVSPMDLAPVYLRDKVTY